MVETTYKYIIPTIQNPHPRCSVVKATYKYITFTTEHPGIIGN
jgi:hypothetical protein